MKRSNSNPNRPLRRRSFRGWLKRVTLSNNHPKKIEPEEMRGKARKIKEMIAKLKE